MTINQVVESQAYVILHQQQIAQLLATRNTKAVKYIIIQKKNSRKSNSNGSYELALPKEHDSRHPTSIDRVVNHQNKTS
jgi:hypothetical protein